MLHDPREVTETNVNELDVVLLDVIQNFVGVREHQPPRRLTRFPTSQSGRANDTLLRGGFPSVSRVFRRCYACFGPIVPK